MKNVIYFVDNLNNMFFKYSVGDNEEGGILKNGVSS